MRRPGAYGPYAHRRKWRVVVVRSGGERTSRLYDTEAEALEVIARVQRAAGLENAVTVEEAITEYELAMKQKGNLPGSIADTIYRLRRIVGTRWMKKPLRLLATAECAKLYHRLSTEPTRTGRPMAVDSHRNMLAEAKTWGQWCVDKGHVKVVPFASVDGTGRRRRGKPQLRIDEARRFTATAKHLALDGDEVAIGVLLLLCLGLRIGEAVSRRVRDVDDGGRVLWVEGKTDAGKRQIIVPRALRPMLVALVQGRKSDAQLFKSRRVEWLRKGLRRICKAARVSYVPPHGLRGTFATMASEILGGVTDELAAMIGHEDPEFTGRVYARPGAGKAAIAESVSALLDEPAFTVVQGGRK
jgi:integrase